MNRLAIVLFIVVGLLALGTCVLRPHPDTLEGTRAAGAVSWQSPHPASDPDEASAEQRNVPVLRGTE
jgi:hypothetical protein